MQTLNNLDYYNYSKEKTAIYSRLSYMEQSIEILTRKKSSKHKPNAMYNAVSSFDIETTTVIDGKNTAGNDCGFAYMYIWQFEIMDISDKNRYILIYGRTWQEYIEFTEMLTDIFSNATIITFCHNFEYEFQFMRKFFEWQNVFCRQKRVPIKATCKNQEYRCSYFLSNMSLAKWIQNSENVTYQKQCGKLDYEKERRTPLTQLNDDEMFYCLVDVHSLNECVIDLLEKNNDTLLSLPLTSTSFVRRDMRNNINKNYALNRSNFLRSKVDLHLFKLLEKAFRGGNTHANRYYSMEIQRNIGSNDIASSYPFSLFEKYPCGEFKPIEFKNEMQLDTYCEKYAVLMTIQLFDVELKEHVSMPYLPTSKCSKLYRDGTIYDNGRILKTEFLEMTLTELDYEIIKNQYNFSELRVMESYYAYKNYLPKELLETVLDYFFKKSQLRGVIGFEYEYNKGKNKLNACYGCAVTSPINSEIQYINHEYIEDEQTDTELAELLEKFYESRNNFLSYAWGVWCTAYARRSLQSALDYIDNYCKENKNGISDVVYCDTDSVKYKYDKAYQKFFDEYNNKIMAKQFPYGLQNFAIDKNGNKLYMGVFDNEGESDGICYDEFITFGAKKYCYRYHKNKKLGITVSGLSKLAVQELNDNIKEFKIGKIFHGKKGVYNARTVAYYNDDDIHTIKIDGVEILTASNIAIIPSTYTLGVPSEYTLLVNGYK